MRPFVSFNRMRELEPTFSQLLSIWWLRTWRGAAAGMLAVAPIALGFYLLERAGIQSGWLKTAEQATIILVGAVIAWFISRMALTKRYSDFRIAFLPVGADGPELPLTNYFVARFWWFLVWRVTLGAAAIGVAGEVLEGWLPGERRALQVITVLMILAWEFFVLRQALTRRYRTFRIAIITETPPHGSTSSP